MGRDVTDDIVRLTVAPGEVDARIVCGLLEPAGLWSLARQTDLAGGLATALATHMSWHEILVRPERPRGHATAPAPGTAVTRSATALADEA